MDKQNMVQYEMEYYSAFKRQEILMHATIQMKLTDTVLSDRHRKTNTK